MRFVVEINLLETQHFTEPRAANMLAAVICENVAHAVMRVRDITELEGGQRYLIEFGPKRDDDTGERTIHARAYVDETPFDSTPRMTDDAVRQRSNITDGLGEIGRALLDEPEPAR